MYCARCQEHIVECECADIEERLLALADESAGMRPAALFNLRARRRSRIFDALLRNEDAQFREV